MARRKHPAVATVIGDVVGSRTAADRSALHRSLTRALTSVSAEADGTREPFAVTAGDEFQGVFDTVGSALDACFMLRLRLLPEVDVRCGVGWGPVTLLDPDGRIQDGPGWWAARAAIEEVDRAERSAATRLVRTAYRRAEGPDGADGPDEAAVAAALLCRDHMVGSLDERSRRVMEGLMAGDTQAQVAGRLGVTPSAVSQRVRAGGIGVVVEAARFLREVR